ncbi:kinase-like domain-containing protein [Mycena floridula]|nr:kinase-like domain-containing protein [Mycena floridula]
MIRLDLFTICAQMLVIFQDKKMYHDFIHISPAEARPSLNLLQQFLDFDELPQHIRSQFTAALIRLSQQSGLYPDCLALTGLQRTGVHRAAGGAFGDVWRGMLRGQVVSVKVARVFNTEVNVLLKAFCREVLVWSQLSHPNVLPLYGIYYLDAGDAAPVCMVSPWMEHGNITEFLTKDAAETINRFSLALDIARGIKYLHEQSIVHGDLKGLNILVTPALRACIMDFGVASIAESKVLDWTSIYSPGYFGGTARWQAPEILNGQSGNTCRSDIYAYGCVCYEIFTGQVPFHEITREITVSLNVLRGVRPTRPSLTELNNAMWQCMEECWKQIKEERPTATDLVNRLCTMPELLGVALPESHWDETFPRSLRSSLHDNPLLPSVEELQQSLKD